MTERAHENLDCSIHNIINEQSELTNVGKCDYAVITKRSRYGMVIKNCKTAWEGVDKLSKRWGWKPKWRLHEAK